MFGLAGSHGEGFAKGQYRIVQCNMTLCTEGIALWFRALSAKH